MPDVKQRCVWSRDHRQIQSFLHENPWTEKLGHFNCQASWSQNVPSAFLTHGYLLDTLLFLIYAGASLCAPTFQISPFVLLGWWPVYCLLNWIIKQQTTQGQALVWDFCGLTSSPNLFFTLAFIFRTIKDSKPAFKRCNCWWKLLGGKRHMRKGRNGLFWKCESHTGTVNGTKQTVEIHLWRWKYDFQECDNSFYRVYRKHHGKLTIPFIFHYKH